MRNIENDSHPRRRRRFAALVLAISFAMLAPPLAVAFETNERAEAGEQLTLWQAVERALSSHPAVGAARAQHAAATAAVGEAKADLRPQVSLVASATQFDQAMVVTPIHGFDPGQTPQFDETLVQAAGQLSYTLFDGGQRGAKISQSRAEAEAAGAGVKGREQAMVARTVSTYLNVLNLREILSAHDQRLSALAAERERVRLRLEVGRAAEVELRRVEATVAAARAERVSLETALDRTEKDLARLIDADVEETRAHRLVAVQLAQFETRDRQSLAEQAAGSSAIVDHARKSLYVAETGVALAKGKRLPQVEVVGKYIDFGSSRGDFSAEWSAGLRLALPLYVGGATRQRIAKAEANREAASEQLRLTIMQVGEELDQALSNIEQAQARHESLMLAVESFLEVARIEKLRLAAGSGTQREYLDAEADLLGARAALAQVKHAEIVARADLARVTGELELAWLRHHLEAVQ